MKLFYFYIKIKSFAINKGNTKRYKILFKKYFILYDDTDILCMQNEVSYYFIILIYSSI